MMKSITSRINKLVSGSLSLQWWAVVVIGRFKNSFDSLVASWHKNRIIGTIPSLNTAPLKNERELRFGRQRSRT